METELSQSIAITGVGVIGPFGMSTEDLWCWLDEDKSNFDECSRYKSPLACSESVKPDLRKMLRSGQLSRAPLISQFAIAAVHMALEQSGISTKNQTDKIAIVYGTSNGPGAATQEIYDDLIEKGASGVKPRVFQESVFNAPASLCSIHFKIKGPIQVVPALTNAGATVLYQAQLLLANPEIEAVVALCSDELCEAIQSGFKTLKWHAKPKVDIRLKPNKDDGAIMSEGAVALVLERADIAQSRGGKVIAELAGASITNDAYQLAYPAADGRGLSLAMKQCLIDARQKGINPDLIFSGSSGTSVDNKLERAAVDSTYKSLPPIVTTKRNIGVAMGASIFFDVALATEILRKNVIPKSLLDQQKINEPISTIMCNGVGLNGLYGSILIRKNK